MSAHLPDPLFVPKVPAPVDIEGVEAKDIAIGVDDSDDASLEQASGINERALLRKLDFRLLPSVIILYLLSFLDRSNGRDGTTHEGTLS